MPLSAATEISSGFGIGFQGCRIQCMGDCDNRNFRKGKLINLQVEEGRAESQHASPEIINTTGQIKNENIEIAGQIPSQLTPKAAVQTVGLVMLLHTPPAL